MKNRIKYMSKTALSTVLAICMLISCLSVGLISTDAAYSNDEPLGYTEYNLSSGQVFYFDNSSTGWSSVEVMVMKKNGGSWSGGPWDLTQVTGSNYWKFTAPSAWSGYTHYLFYNGTWSNSTQTDDIEGELANSSWYTNCFTPTSGTKWNGSFSKCVGVKNFAVTPSPTISGAGTSGDPYIVARNTSITLTASSDSIDSNYTTKYSFDGSTYGTTTTSSFTSSSTGDYSFDKTVYVKTTRGSYESSVTSKKVYFKTAPAETTYNVTVQSANTSQGTVASSSVQAGATTPVTLPTATPAYGYKFKNWTATTGLTLTNATSASGATVKATRAGTVTANFEPDPNMQLYIAGRFHVQTTDTSGSWTNSFDSGDWSNTGDENIPFTYYSGTTYKLETHASLKNLSDNISGYIPYFFIYDKTNTKYWYRATANTTLTSSNTSTTMTKYNSQTDSVNTNLRFNDQSTDKPVIIYFNVVTGALSYEVPTYYTVTCNTATGGSVTANTNREKEGETVTLTLSPNAGYTISGVTVKDASNNNVTVSGSGDTRTFVMPASNVTVTPSFTETTHSVTVKRRYYNYNGTTQLSVDSSAYQTLTGVGIATAKSTNAAPTMPNYTFKQFTLPTGVTLASGSLTTTAAISVNATVDNATIYIDYWETVYTITTSNDGHGTIQRNSSNVSSTSIGNVTAVSLSAVNNQGYAFKEWVITAASSGGATTVVINGTSYSISTTATTIAAATQGATSTFKFNGKATLRANFQAVDYSINVSFPSGNSYTLDSTTGNNVSVSADGHNIGSTYRIVVILADGYEVASITGTGITSTMPTPTVSGRTYSYQYTLGSTDVYATVTLKAKTPTLSNVQVRNNSTTSFPFGTVASRGTVNNYFRQPTSVKATTDSFSRLTFTTKTTGGTQIATVTNVTSGTAKSLDASTSVIPETKDGYAEYRLYVTATNAPAGVTAATTEFDYCTIRVYFNNNQKVYFTLKNLLRKCIRENESSNPYYQTGARLSDYNAAYDAAKTYIYQDYNYNPSTGVETYSPTNADYPVYNADNDSANLTNANLIYNTFKSEYRALRQSANTTTIYVLSKVANSSTYPKYMHVWSNGTGADWDHFNMFNCSEVADDYEYISDDTVKMSYAGLFTYSNSSKYLYKITYPGKAKFIVWRGSSSTDVNMDNSDKLTGDVTNATDFKEYYINAYNTDPGSTSITSVVDYVDFDHTKSSEKTMLEIGESKTGAELKTLLGINPISSLITAPGITVTNQSYTIEGPVGKSSSKLYDMKNNRVSSNGGTTWTTLENGKFPAAAQGKYIVNYVTRFGTNASGGDILRTCTTTLWVAFDEISIYVDMNDNVGNPILNFKYYIKNDVPVAAGTSGADVTQLPYEMDLVSGSDSIYKYTISISKLRDQYKIAFNNNTPIKVSYLTIEDYFVNANGKTTTRPTGAAIDNYAYQIGIDAKITGEVWLKADSTNLKTFNQISYGSANKTFVAVLEDGNNTVLSNAMNSVHGTGINTDDEDMVYNSRYAALYTMDGEDDPTYTFGYVLRTSAKQELAGSGNTKYYFDKWVAMSTPADGVVITDGCLTTSYSSATDYSTDSNLNFTSAVDYLDGDGNSNDTTYIALYKTAASNDSTVRIEVTYKFNDFDTSDGNYIYEEGKTVPATYTKTIKVPVGSGQTYASFDAVNNVTAINSIVSSGENLPRVVSNYFNYAYKTNSAEIKSATSGQSKIVVTAELTETAREYSIVLKNGSGSTAYNGYYQQTVELPSTGRTNPVWQIQSGTDNWVTLGSGETDSTFTARFVSNAESENSTDCQIIKVVNDSATAASHKSVVSNSFTEIYYDNVGTEMLGHNFYIIDYCDEGELLGGGVLYATTDSSGNYRQNSATTNLATATTRHAFITGILGTDYSTEYKAQTINNIGFRYKPYKETEDVFRYSDEIGAYLTMFEGTNVNSSNYEGQKLRLFSFMVYNNGENAVIVPSDGYAEVSRYIPQS